MERGNGRVHVTVLGNEVVRHLQPVSGGIYVDGTLGLGGHAYQILKASSPDGRVIGIEWDEQALALARERLAPFGRRFLSARSSYADVCDVLQREGVERVDGMVLDLGVSSLQLDEAERGFSFRADAPLDMRMDARNPVTAASLVAELSGEQLADIFYNYGEERQSRRIAARIVKDREKGPIDTTAKLAALVESAIPRKYHPRKKHVATKVFQALRIAVNRELDNLVRFLREAPDVLAGGARVCVITFHSIEDRIVKQMFGANPEFRVITGKPVLPGESEVAANPRARSAKLRVAERI